MEYDETMFEAQWRVLGHNGGYTEIRIPNKRVQEFVVGYPMFSKSLVKYYEADTYVGINPRKSQSGKAEDVAFLNNIVLDFDPIRPKDEASTTEQHLESLAVASRVNKEYFGGNAYEVSSGSGAHLYLPIEPIEITDWEETTECLKELFRQIRDKYSTSSIKIDSTHDLPRIYRAWGTFNTRSQRWCGPVMPIPDVVERIPFSIKRFHVAKSISPVQSTAATGEAFGTRFQRLLASNAALRDILDGVAEYPSRSESDYALVSILAKAKFTTQQIKAVVKTNPLGKAHERTEREIDRDIERIVEQIEQKSSILSEEADEYTKELLARSPGIPIGFKRFDEMTAGLKPRFYVMAARPGDGKTTLLVQLAKNVARKGLTVLMFPTEVPRAAIYDKLVSAETGINLKRFQLGRFSDDEVARIKKATDDLKTLPLVIAEKSSPTLEYITRTTNEVMPDLLIVDFLNCMKYVNELDASELTANVKGIKSIGQKLGIPVILSAQLNRSAVGVQASLTHLKGCGALEEEGEVISYIITTSLQGYPTQSMWMILKNKYGEVGNIPMNFHRSTCIFEEK